ncbi:MAG: TonB-dependent receptor [Hyphomonadaceae bacterium]|nr:TonB-dependent receptor [Hyphomonadaceae bacterium]
MKYPVLAAGLCAACVESAGAQIQADFETEQDTQCITQVEGEGCSPDTHSPGLGLSDEIIIVGSRIGYTDTDTLTTPASVLSEEVIRARNSAYVSDLLRSLPGISLNQSGSRGHLSQLRLRGTEANHVLVLIDGVEASNPNTGEFDFAGIRAEDVVRIEVLRGEQSALWGPDAIGGVINVITRAGDADRRFAASVEGGSFNTVEGQISAVIPVGDAALSINGNVFNTDGYDISGLDIENDGSRSRSLNVGLNRVDIGALQMNAKFGTSYLKSGFDSDTDFDGRLNNTNEELTTETITARIDGRFELAGFEHQITGAWNETKMFSSNDTAGDRLKAGWVIRKTLDGHKLTVLGEIEQESFKTDGGEGEPQNQGESTTIPSLAADYRYDNGPVTLSVSGRADFNDRFGDAQTWQLGAGYRFSWDGRVRGSVGTGIKNPTFTELFGYFPGSFVGNPDLQPETSLGYNIGYTQTLLTGNFEIGVDYFRSELEDEIRTIFGPTTTAVNSATDSIREGLEVELRWKAGDSMNIRGSVTLLDSEENGVEEVRRPGFLASATATWRPVEPLSLTLLVDHTGRQMDTDFGTFEKVELDPYTLVGLSAAYDVNNIVTLTLRGDNLLGENYQEVVGYASQGRGIFAGVRANFQ